MLDRAGVPRRRRGLSQEQVGLAEQGYCSGSSLEWIANALGVTAHTVRSALLKRGVAMRDTHGRDR